MVAAATAPYRPRGVTPISVVNKPGLAPQGVLDDEHQESRLVLTTNETGEAGRAAVGAFYLPG